MYKYITADMQEWDIDYTYEAAEPNGSDTPGSPAVVTIDGITEDGVPVPLDNVSPGVINELQRAILREYEGVKPRRPWVCCGRMDWAPAPSPCGAIRKP